MTIRLQHEWTPEHLTTAVALWRRLIEVHRVSAYERKLVASGSHYSQYVASKDVTDEWITALVISDGEGVEYDTEHDGYRPTYPPIDLELISYSDHGGSDLDAANVRALDGTPYVTVRTGDHHGEGSAATILGETPAGDDLPTALGWLKSLVETMEGLEQYALIDEEAHSEYIDELADEAWGQWLHMDVRADVEKRLGELMGDDEAAWDVVEARETAEEDPYREAFYSYEHPTGEAWQAESATSVRHVHYDAAVNHVLVRVFARKDVQTDCTSCKHGSH